MHMLSPGTAVPRAAVVHVLVQHDSCGCTAPLLSLSVQLHCPLHVVRDEWSPCRGGEGAVSGGVLCAVLEVSLSANHICSFPATCNLSLEVEISRCARRHRFEGMDLYM